MQQFISQFTKALEMPVGLLAVGSSTFPADFWDYHKELNEKDPSLKARLSYKDIDLLVSPVDVFPFEDVKERITSALTLLNYPSESHESTKMGVRYVKATSYGDDNVGKDCISPFLDIGYGIHSITTRLQNDRSLDLICGREDQKRQTLLEKVSSERKNNHAFCLVHGKEYLD